MKTTCSTLLLALTCGPTLAALAPLYQNPKDLAVMLAFVQQHPQVMQSLRSIDLENQVVHFGDGCKAQFGRAAAPAMPGPAPALVFKSASCPVGPATPLR